jgi:hypothetical protein
MKKLYSTNNRVTLYLLKSKLEENGIFCTIKNENPPLAGEIPSIIALPELWALDEKQYATAMNIIETELKTSATKQEWTCPQCHELLEKQFDICWKCGSSR